MAKVEGKICDWQSIDAMTYAQFQGEPYDPDLDQAIISFKEYEALELYLAMALDDRADEIEFAESETKLNPVTGELAFKITFASDGVTTYLLWSCDSMSSNSHLPSPTNSLKDEAKAALFSVVSGGVGGVAGYMVGDRLKKPIPVPAALIGAIVGVVGSIALTRSNPGMFGMLKVSRSRVAALRGMPSCGSCR